MEVFVTFISKYGIGLKMEKCIESVYSFILLVYKYPIL